MKTVKRRWHVCNINEIYFFLFLPLQACNPWKLRTTRNPSITFYHQILPSLHFFLRFAIVVAAGRDAAYSKSNATGAAHGGHGCSSWSRCRGTEDAAHGSGKKEFSPFMGKKKGVWAYRGIAKTAMTPLTKAAIAATAKAGEFPPLNS